MKIDLMNVFNALNARVMHTTDQHEVVAIPVPAFKSLKTAISDTHRELQDLHDELAGRNEDYAVLYKNFEAFTGTLCEKLGHKNENSGWFQAQIPLIEKLDALLAGRGPITECPVHEDNSFGVSGGGTNSTPVCSNCRCPVIRLNNEDPLVCDECEHPLSFQDRVHPWMMHTFGPEIASDKLERCDRFIEEALELVQASGYSEDRAYALVDYVFNRPIGETSQEVGGVMVTLAALCLAHGVNMHQAAETELARVWEKSDQIKAKQASKPHGSALPIPIVAQKQDQLTDKLSETKLGYLHRVVIRRGGKYQPSDAALEADGIVVWLCPTDQWVASGPGQGERVYQVVNPCTGTRYAEGDVVPLALSPEIQGEGNTAHVYIKTGFGWEGACSFFSSDHTAVTRATESVASAESQGIDAFYTKRYHPRVAVVRDENVVHLEIPGNQHER